MSSENVQDTLKPQCHLTVDFLKIKQLGQRVTSIDNGQSLAYKRLTPYRQIIDILTTRVKALLNCTHKT
jgi:hypothetical protein